MRIIMRSHREREAAQTTIKLEDKEPIEDETDARILDQLCLALGLLTNLVQESEDSEDTFRQTRMLLSGTTTSTA